jgi:hypothetical protein
VPASGLALHDYVAAVPRALDLEYSTDAFAAKHVLARRADIATSMSAETHDRGLPGRLGPQLPGRGSRAARERRPLARLRAAATDVRERPVSAGGAGRGCVVLDSSLSPVSSTVAARGWISSFPEAPLLTAFSMLPAVIYPAAATAREGTTDAGTHLLVQTVDRPG